MKVSLNWIRFLNEKYHCSAEPAPDGIDKLVEKIGLQLGAVEEVINLGERYEEILVVKVIKSEKHPNANKLSLCLVDDGGMNKKVKREDGGLIQIVCGASNVRAGMLAVWIPPGATVPSTYEREPFVIEARPIRNKTSHGMLASAKELALGDDHTGIVEIKEDVNPGAAFAEVVGLNDYVIDVENKMFTHRPDLFGQLGIVREIAGIQHRVFKSPNWYKEDATLKSDGRNNSLKIKIKNDVPKLVPRFCTLAIKDVRVQPSPIWLQVRLSAVGIRPINNIVDLTNFFMMETAQPLHAYDYDKVKTGVLGVRLSKKGEKLALLNGKELKLDDGAVVITDGTKAIGLAAIMGGADTEVDENTKNIILECASFDMNQTRKTAMHYGLYTDAATRFTKNQSPRQNRAVIVKAAEDILRIAGGRVSGGLVDDNHLNKTQKPVKLTANFINSRLGLDLSPSQIKKLLENVEFEVKQTGETLEITVPFWRTDIKIPEDVVEEAGRLYGYEKLPQVLPPRDLAPAQRNRALDFKARTREILRTAGANEVLTYSFVHGSLFKKVGQSKDLAFQLKNALSPDLQYYRQCLTPSLLEKVQSNIRAGFDYFALYEIGVVHNKETLGDDKLPLGQDRVSLVIAGKNSKTDAPYFAAKYLCDYLLSELGISDFEFSPPDPSKPKSKFTTYYEEQRTADIRVGGKTVGKVGEYRSDVKLALKLPKFCAGFDIRITEIMPFAEQRDYKSLNRFPELEQDFCLRSSSNLSYQELTSFMNKSLSKLSEPHGYDLKLEPLDIFQKQEDKDHKQTTWRIILCHPERTLTTQETNNLLDKLADMAKKELKAERI